MPILYMASTHTLAWHELNILALTLSNNGFATPRIFRLMLLRFCSTIALPGIRFDINLLIAMLKDKAFAPT